MVRWSVIFSRRIRFGQLVVGEGPAAVVGEPGEDLMVIEGIGNGNQGGKAEYNGKFQIVALIDLGSLEGKEQGARHPAHEGDEQKNRQRHVAHAQEIGQGILGEAGQEKEDKGNNKISLADQMVESLVEGSVLQPAADQIA